MAIDFLCSGCGEAFSVPESLAGKKAKCESCGTIVQVPNPAETVELMGGQRRGNARRPKPQAPQQQARQAQKPAQAQPAVPAQPIPQQPLASPQQPVPAQPIPAQPIQQAAPVAGVPLQQAPGQPVPVGQGMPAYQPTGKSGGGGLSVGAWIGIGAGALVAVVAIVVVAVMMMGGKNDEVAQGDGDDTNQAATDTDTTNKKADRQQAAGKTTEPVKRQAQSKQAPTQGMGMGRSNNRSSTGSSSSQSKTKKSSSANNQKSPSSSNNSSNNNSSTNNSKTNANTSSKTATGPKLGSDFSKALKRAKARFAKMDQEREKREKQRAAKSKKEGPALAAGPTLAAWKAKADPSTQNLELPKGKISINLEKYRQIYFPENPSRHVLVTYQDGKNYLWACFDLFETKKAGKPNPFGKPIQGQDPPRLRTPVLSADGKYMASRVDDGGTKSFRIWSFESGTVFRDIEVDKNNRSDEIHFVGLNKVLTTTSPEFYKVQLDIWNLSDGKKLRSITLGKDRNNPFTSKSIAVSHGGKYVVGIVGAKLVVYEVASGDLVGEAAIPQGYSSCHAVKFSNDGEKVAGLFRGENGGYLVLWDFRNGEVLVDYAYEERLPSLSYYGPVLDWMPDDSGLIFKGRIMADAKTGLEVWNFPKTTPDARKIIKRGDRVDMMLVLKQKSANFLTTATLPSADIAKTIQAVRTTGSLLDANLPPSTTPNLISARQVSLPSGNIAWSAKPVDAGPAAAITTRDVVLVDQKAHPKGILFTPPHAGRAVVYFQPQQKRSGSGRRKVTIQQLHSVNLSNGRASAALDMPSIYQLLDVAPSGNLALVGIKAKRGGFRRIDVVSFEPKKHVAAWRPYEGEDEDKKNRHSNIKAAVWVKQLTDELVATVNGKGKFIVWKMPSCEAVYIIEDFGQPVAVSPKGKYILGLKNQKMYIFESATGACHGELAAPSVSAKSVRAAFHPRGLRLCALVKGTLDHECVVWDLQTGKIERQFPVPPFVAAFHDFRYVNRNRGGSIGWRGDNHILTEAGNLLNLQKQCLVWSYVMAVNRFGAPVQSFGNQHLYMGRKEFQAPWTLMQVDMPNSEIKRNEEFARLEDQLVLFPGASVRLEIRLSAGAGSVSESQVRTGMEGKLKERGIQVSNSAPLSLLVTSKQGSTGTTIEVTKSRFPSFSPFRRRPTPGAKTFQQQKMVCVMSLMEGQKVLWKREAGVTMRSYGSVKKETAEQDLTKEMKQSFSKMMASGSALDRHMATFVFKDREVLLEGRRSVLAEKGETEYVKPDPSKKPTRTTRPGFRPGFGRSPFGGRRPGFPRSPFR